MHVLRDAGRGVQGDRRPDRFDILLMDSVASQEVTGGICAVNLEAFLRGAVLMRPSPCRGTSRLHKAVRDRISVRDACLRGRPSNRRGSSGETAAVIPCPAPAPLFRA